MSVSGKDSARFFRAVPLDSAGHDTAASLTSPDAASVAAASSPMTATTSATSDIGSLTDTPKRNPLLSRRAFMSLAPAVAAMSLAAPMLCSCTEEDEEGVAAVGALTLDMDAWNYDEGNDVYWQVGVCYCTTPAAKDYESLGIYVPGAYFIGEENEDGSFTCSINASGSVAGLTPSTAPFVIPVNTAGYSAQPAPTGYSHASVSEYLEAGFIYVYPGCRGRDNGYNDDGSLAYSGGAPWGVTDLKAAIRFIRYNAKLLPGNSEKIFTFGHSGGGAQSAIVGASGDSALYEPYLNSIGAALADASGAALSDAIAGAMCWCPITSLDMADEAYEWMMGQYSTSGVRAEGAWTKLFSNDLACAYADYINELGLEDTDGRLLELNADPAEDNSASADVVNSPGICTYGTYYDMVKAAIEESLDNFLEDTEFPYTPSSSTMADGGFGGGLNGAPDGTFDSGTPGGMPDGGLSGEASDGGSSGDLGGAPGGTPEGTPDAGGLSGATLGGAPESGFGDAAPGGGSPGDESGVDPVDVPGDMLGDSSNDRADGNLSVDLGGAPEASGTAVSGSSGNTAYATPSDYIAALNSDETWIHYDEQSNTATITDVSAFVRHCKSASKDVPAFDDLNRSQAENKVFGNDGNEALHFDSTAAGLLIDNAKTYAAAQNWEASYTEAWEQDIKESDCLGTDMATRVAMYNPMAYLCSYYEQEGTSVPAPHWRIRSGIEQGDTSITVELNLALVLESCDSVESVDFATVWGQGHTAAERVGTSTANFISWVRECL